MTQITKCYKTTWVGQGSLHDLLAWPVTKDSRVWNIAMFTNTNVGQCHSQLVSVNHLGCKCNSLISCPHLLRLSTGGVMSRHAPMWVSTLITCSQWGVKEGVIAISTVCNDSHSLVPRGAIHVACTYFLRLATCDLIALHATHNLLETSAGQLLQLIWSSVQGSLLNPISVLVRIITPTDW